MDIKRHITVQAVLTEDNKLIPIWDNKVIFTNTEMYGEVITLEGDNRHKHQRVVECVLDIQTKELSLGIELNYYPTETQYKKDEVVYHEKSFKRIQEVTIKEIVFEKFDTTIDRGNRLEDYWKQHFKHESFDSNTIYCIKNWKPTYILSNGVKVDWEHQLFKKL